MRRRAAGGTRPATTALSAGNPDSPHGAYRGTDKCSFTRRQISSLPECTRSSPRDILPHCPGNYTVKGKEAAFLHSHHTLPPKNIITHSYFWWLLESHLSGCFCFFPLKFREGGGDLQIMFCQSVSTVQQYMVGHSNLECFYQIH